MKYTGRVEVIIENDRGPKKSAMWEKTIRRVSERLNFHWVDLNKPLGRVSCTWSVTEECYNGTNG